MNPKGISVFAVTFILAVMSALDIEHPHYLIKAYFVVTLYFAILYASQSKKEVYKYESL